MRITNYKDFENVINYGLFAIQLNHASKVVITFQMTRSVFTISLIYDYYVCYFKNQIYSLVPFNQPFILLEQIKFLISKYGGWEGVTIVYKKKIQERS